MTAFHKKSAVFDNTQKKLDELSRANANTSIRTSTASSNSQVSTPSVHANISDDSSDIDEIDKLVSLTFDENPKIRKKVVEDLSKHSQDPRALLALFELSSDKDAQISIIAKSALGSYKQTDAEAFTSLEKFFADTRREAPESQEELQTAQNRLMPSLEKLFSKNVVRDKLMPSLEKLFSHSSSSSHQASQKNASDGELSSIEFVHSRKALLEQAEKSVGIPVSMQAPEELREKRYVSSQTQTSFASKDKHPTQAQLDDAADFPLPEHLENIVHSPVASIPIMGDEIVSDLRQAEDNLPISRLDYYKWAYTFAIKPGIKASDIKKEKLRLIKEIQQNIDVAFRLAVARAREEGIDSLSGLKPGMKKLTTLPLEVVDHQLVCIPKGKTKTIELSRLLLSDGKQSLPLYVAPSRAEGIRTGDLVSLRGAFVDYLIKDAAAPEDAKKGELVFRLSKHGQLIVTK
ncbi:MAG: hypothetical protein WC492_05195 [Candidatus Micrarchaeia archaeon]